MIPSAFVPMPHLPLTPSGKLNRQLLPAPDGENSDRDKDFVAPRTPIEKEMAEIWRELLEIEKVGVHDNFFELGGHSLLLTRLVSRMRKAFQVEVTIRVLFDAPTISGMTAAILARQAEQVDKESFEYMLQKVKELSTEEVNELLKAGD